MASPSDVISDMLQEDRLVDMWPEFPCLYDVRSTDFKNRDKRLQALQTIADGLGESVDWVKIKLRLLRNSYTKAKKTVNSSGGRKNPTKRTAWLLEKLQFLAPYVATRPALSNLESKVTTDADDLDPDCIRIEDSEDLFYDEGPSVTEPSEIDTTRSRKQAIQPRTQSIKKHREEEEYQPITEMSNAVSHRCCKRAKMSEQNNEIDSFGRYISESLNKLDPMTKHIAQQSINNILFLATLSNNPQKMNPQKQIPPTTQQMFQQTRYFSHKQSDEQQDDSY